MLLPRRNASSLVGILIYIADRRISNSNIYLLAVGLSRGSGFSLSEAS
jgi:hypothetical protein